MLFRMKMRLAVTCLIGVVWVACFCGCVSTPRSSPGRVHDFGRNNPNLYIAMGDSITLGDQYGNYPAMLSGMLQKEIVNLGVGGSFVRHGANQTSAVLARYRPGYLLILYGANDVIHETDGTTTIGHLRYMIRAAKQNKTIPVLATLLPMTESHRLFQRDVGLRSAMIRKLARDENVLLCDLEQDFRAAGALWGGLHQADGLHPNTTGLQLIAERFYTILK